jgi:hypothetical protein
VEGEVLRRHRRQHRHIAPWCRPELSRVTREGESSRALELWVETRPG